MNIHFKMQPRFATGPDCRLDMTLGDGFITGARVQDRSPNNNHGLAVNSPAPKYPGFLFDQDAGMNIGASDNLSNGVYPISMIAWTYTLELETERSFFSVANSATTEHQTLKLKGPAGRPAIFSYMVAGTDDAQAGQFVRAAVSVITGIRWKHVAATVLTNNLQTWRIHQDGEFKAIGSDVVRETLANNNRWMIGDEANNGTTSNPWYGGVGDVMFFRRILTAAEIKSHYMLTRHRYNA